MTHATPETAPSLSPAWFESLRQTSRLHAEEFRKLGFVDTRFVIRATEPTADFPTAVGIVFDTYECERIVPLESEHAGADFDPDFVLEAPAAVWREMLDNVRAHGKADLSHTINTLVLGGTARLSAGDQLREDLFYRYNGSLQLFFDLAAEVPARAV